MTTITDKANYVRARLGANHRDHACHWPGCTQQVHPAQWGCKPHWFTLPPGLRKRIWKAFDPGQEIRGTPSPEYVAVARDVQTWIEEREAKRA